ncbi:cytochrome b/b6 domain-containing protein [Hymenobacter sp. BT730]|uniref:cytochrome b/b6 domain-containing protein n=1 Tax=Hymenobacter sp. BT730 TaxID=3063332 RepID=UPI0026DFA8C9|nr:cytochrome b/b6 domain-containing protein [Hymenobacter sp. BT730]
MAQPTITETSSAKKYSAGLRIWHWANWAVISGLLSTILFLKVIINMRGLFPKMQEALAKNGIEATKEQLRGIGGLVSHRIWDWHIYLGITLSGLLLWRIVVEITQPASQKFSARLHQAKQSTQDAPLKPFRLRHSVAVKYSYLIFYVLLLVMVVTGLALTYADDVEALHKLEHTIKEVHNVNMYLILAFFAVHLGGVVWAELTKDRGVVSEMIHGGGPHPTDKRA